MQYTNTFIRVLAFRQSSAKTLVVSYVGMTTQEVTIHPYVKVTMQSDAEGGEEAAVRGRRSIINSTTLNTQWNVRAVKPVGPQIAGMAVERATSKTVEFTAKAMEKVQISKTVSKQKFVVK